MRFYSNNAVVTALTAGINNSDTSMQVVSTSGFPVSYPYTLAIDKGEVTEELVEVTAAVGTTLTITRGADNTAATDHSAAAAVEHVVSARDFREPQDHIAASTGVHGVAGDVMGTNDVQTVTNKDFTDPTNSFGPNVALPSGVVVPFAGATAPEGWLLCDGAEVSRATYAALFNAIGETHGAGDGVNTFNLPDTRGRHVLGAGTGTGLTARTLGAKAGAEDAVNVSHSHGQSHAHGASSNLTPDHTHSGSTGFDDRVHTHPLGTSDSGGLAGGGTLVRKGGSPAIDMSGGGSNHAHAFTTAGGGGHSHSITVNSDSTATNASGVSGTDKNMAPYLVLNHLIKT